ncbi:hypothetical protein Tco_0321277 [Tanacetum coccineum]
MRVGSWSGGITVLVSSLVIGVLSSSGVIQILGEWSAESRSGVDRESVRVRHRGAARAIEKMTLVSDHYDLLHAFPKSQIDFEIKEISGNSNGRLWSGGADMTNGVVGEDVMWRRGD